jgi:hypothetical protein
MGRKKWTPKTEVTDSLLKFREKRKWQIALRRYVLKEQPCGSYAPYFALDIKNIRKWFEFQFTDDLNWDNFGVRWQFDHIIPVTYFDFSLQQELKLCWNFINIRPEPIQLNKDRGNRVDILAARGYFKDLYEATQYKPCLQMLSKIESIEISQMISTTGQQEFIRKFRPYLEMIENYSEFEFELLNSGRSVDEVNKEIEFIKRFR